MRGIDILLSKFIAFALHKCVISIVDSTEIFFKIKKHPHQTMRTLLVSLLVILPYRNRRSPSIRGQSSSPHNPAIDTLTKWRTAQEDHQ